MNEIYMGKSNGEEVYTTLFNMLITGQTQLSGKTTTIKALAPEAVDEYGIDVLIFDSKPTGREFPEYPAIPIVYEPTTDALILIGLLESIFRRRLTPFYSTLARLTEGADDLGDILKNAVKMEEKAKSGFIKDACHTLADLIRRLQKELEGKYLVSELSATRGIHVMPINELSVEAQQLVIRTAFRQALSRSMHKNKIMVIDEAWRFLPESFSSACKRDIYDYATQGAKTKRFVWLATQFLAPTDKDALKAMPIKLLGRQDHATEVEHTLRAIPGYKGAFKPEDIMKLKKGEFIFVDIEGSTKKVYVQPPWEREGYVEPLSIPSEKVVPYASDVMPIPQGLQFVAEEEVPEELVRRLGNIERRIEEFYQK